MPKISILRMGHRIGRDVRVTTHCALAARALGADEFILYGEQDDSMLESVRKVVSNWGGKFTARYSESWKKAISEKRRKKFTIVHLTFYGLPVQKTISEIRAKSKKGLLIIIGAEKVPSEVYKLSDFNISVTNQPHSEIAALSIFLHEYFSGKELSENFQKKRFRSSKIRIIPKANSKEVVRSGKR